MLELITVNIALIACFLWVWFFFLQYNKLSMREALQSFAKTNNGVFQSGSEWLSANHDRVMFLDNNGNTMTLEARVKLYREQRPGRFTRAYSTIHISATVPGFRPKLEIFRENIFGSMSNLLGAQDILIRDPSYDRKFVIRSDDSIWTTQLLYKCDELKTLHLEHPGARIRLTDNKLTLEAEGRYWEPHELDALTRLAKLFIEEIISTPYITRQGGLPGQLSIATTPNDGMLSLADNESERSD